QRHGSDLIIVWDADEPASDLYVKAAYSVTRALTIRERTESKRADQALLAIEQATRNVEKQIKFLDEVRVAAETVERHGKKIAERAVSMKGELEKEVTQLDGQIASLKTDENIR